MTTPLHTLPPKRDPDRPGADEAVWAELVDEADETSAMPAARRRWTPWSLLRLVFRGMASAWEWLFGVATLIGGLAVLAAIPVVGLLSLGYLLEVGGRVARTGKLRNGFIGVCKAARIGTIVLGTWLMLLPLRLVSSLLATAQIIDPGGPQARMWKVVLIVLTAVMAAHIALATLRGGKLRYYLWPIGNLIWLVRQLARGGYYAEARDAVWDFVTALRLPYYFWLGLRGFLVGFLWLVLPISLLALGRKAPLLGIIGGITLGLVLLFLPFLQMRFAAENRLRAGFELGAVLSRFGRAPWAFGFAFFITLLFALPLYLLKIEMIPREAAWLPSLVFIVFIFPARLLAGWAYGRAERRPAPRHWFFAATGLMGMIPSAAFYVLIVYLTQYTSWEGVWSLYEQHAFLLPVPFMGM
jgi:hypothetical protein